MGRAQISMAGLAGATLALATPAQGQTLAEAARANLAAGAELCLRGRADIATWPDLFRATGFAETVERSATNADTTHTFTDPANTVTVVLYYGETPDNCVARTSHIGVTAASEVLDALAPRLVPGHTRFVTPGDIDPATGRPALCVRYEDPANPIGHVVGVTTDAGCVPDGTSLIFSSYRV